MSGPDDDAAATPLANAPVTAKMTLWMTVDAHGDECLFGFAVQHPTTGGLSWVLSTPIVEFTQTADRARTESGRVHALGRQISSRDLDEEGRVALRLLLADDMSEYPGRNDDVAWLTSQKMARHLGVGPPPRGAYVAVEQFIERHRRAYLALRGGWPWD
jgi:hypothetical protein